MQGLIMAAQMIAALTILVTIHEFGHYIAARMFGVRVDKFYVFFDAWGKKLFSFKKGDTEYGVGWLPLGGYVKIAGMIDESMDKEYLTNEPQPWEFRSKPAWQKLIIMLAGIILNVVLGIFIFTIINLNDNNVVAVNDIGTNYQVTEYGESIGLQEGDRIIGANGEEFFRMKDINYELAFGGHLDVERNGQTVQLPVPEDHFKSANQFFYLNSDIQVAGLRSDVPYANEAGFKEGDIIQSINGTSYSNFQEFAALLDDLNGDEANFTVLRNGEEIKLNSMVSEEGEIGIRIDNVLKSSYEISDIGLGQAMKFGFADAFNIVWLNMKAFAQIGTGKLKAKDSVGGPIKIATMFGPNWDWLRFWSLTGALSMVLAFMNILPIPALDGGHAVFAIYEMVSGREVNERVLEIAQMTGFIILMTLMVFIFWNDIRTVFFGG